MSQLVVSCGIGIAGIVGAKATEEVRAMASSERRADYMDALSVDIDSYRRRKELADAAGNRDWGDVDVDRFSNVVVTPDHVPALDSHDDLQAFDRMLMNAPAAQREKEQMLKQALPEPSEFVFSDDDGDHDQS